MKFFQIQLTSSCCERRSKQWVSALHMFLAVATTSFSFSLIFSKLPVAKTRNMMTTKMIKMTEVHLLYIMESNSFSLN